MNSTLTLLAGHILFYFASTSIMADAADRNRGFDDQMAWVRREAMRALTADDVF